MWWLLIMNDYQEQLWTTTFDRGFDAVACDGYRISIYGCILLWCFNFYNNLSSSVAIGSSNLHCCLVDNIDNSAFRCLFKRSSKILRLLHWVDPRSLVGHWWMVVLFIQQLIWSFIDGHVMAIEFQFMGAFCCGVSTFTTTWLGRYVLGKVNTC